MKRETPARLSRRHLLELGGTAALAALAGCSTEPTDESAPPTAESSTTTTTSAAPTTPAFLRTPEERFQGLVGFDYKPKYLATAEGLRLHYLDEGSGDAGVALLLHGEPTWSYLYRNVIPTLAAAGYRCIAPDHIGFGRSDKVTEDDWYTLDAHVATLKGVIEELDLTDITLVCQDWGGPNGLITAVDADSTAPRTSDPSHPMTRTSRISTRDATTPNRSTGTSRTPSGSTGPTASATPDSTSTSSATPSV